MEEATKRILTWMNGEKTGPVKLQLNPTNRCNIKCRFCWLRDFDKTETNYEEIEPDRYLELIKEASELGVKNIEITGGGEPLLRKDILSIMGEIKRQGFYGELITNGTLFTTEMIKAIVDMEWDRIVFSLDAPDAKTNDFLRGLSGAFEKTVNAIKTFDSVKTETDTSKPEICIHMVMCSRNYDKIAEMFEFAHKLGCNNLFIEPIVLLALETGAGKELMITGEYKKQLLLELERSKNVARKHQFKTNVDKLKFKFIESANRMDEMILEETENGAIPCYYPWYQMIIRPWGIVGPCCMFDNIGDNVKEKTLKEIWFGEHFSEIRKKLKRGSLPKYCFKCNSGQVQENIKIRRALQEHEN